MKTKIVTGLAVMLAMALIAVGSGNFVLPPGELPAEERSTLPSGFYPYSGYHYSGYVVAKNPDKSFDFYTGRIQNFGRDTWADEVQTNLVKTDESTIFYRINHQGKEEQLSFEDLKLNQLVWLKAVERNGEIVLKIQLSD